MGAHDGFETGFIGQVVAVAILQLIHPLEAEADAPLGPIDFPFVVIFVARSESCGFKGPVGALSHVLASRKFCEEGCRVVDRDFFDAFAGGSFEAECLSLARTFLDKGFLKTDSFSDIANQESGGVDQMSVQIAMRPRAGHFLP